ncbi:ABC transporter ATP-binding protein [Celeribacter halophilus]|uniref:Carbohydrate ABC transporter ATP-binding protein, CUT1 family (TC 3.A.1.1.-) n=1 Tax=Celeribacter halophilus TaxID=576117 RepID=A0A1I3WZL1_9RHOB|nr:sn-glycerol-3-phosphate ABC transporter ATP-binding protein UgpC [Celeribacter halophilus]PZX04716.1 sn-glycerol 3-phosphate transport system ATP-binding protein/multiple sugar transport system ATP-binding protein [Celeribacter halophilus]SFK12875.1 carbohydrate ABC transporter ATP-binding protein, CUT1 family (TC 3.A.1.1.-) [Celeribacter halophilus]
MVSINIQNLEKHYGKVKALHGLNLEIADGEFIVLVGPSGCGKSTLLRCVAGLNPISGGDILFNGTPVGHLPPQDRDLSMVFQNYALYPHLTVAQNLAFGLKVRKTPAEEIEKRVKWAADILAITPYLDRRPRALSGGQRQRVAMGRAMVKHSNAFLFDEPLSNLDAQLRVQMRKEIRALQQRIGVTSIYVTHDQVEAMTMGDRIVVMKDGRIEQVGSPSELYTAPRTRFVAGFIGSPQMSFVTAQADGHQMTLSDGTVLTSATAATGAVTLGIRPEHFLDHTSEANRLTLDVTNQQVVGTSTSYFANLGGGEIEVIRQGSDTERPATLALGIRPEHIMVFDKDNKRIAA